MRMERTLEREKNKTKKNKQTNKSIHTVLKSLNQEATTEEHCGPMSKYTQMGGSEIATENLNG